MEGRCSKPSAVRSSRIPKRMLLDGYTSGALARVVAHTDHADSTRSIVRHLTGVTRVSQVTADQFLWELLLDEVPYSAGGKEWHRALLTIGGHL